MAAVDSPRGDVTFWEEFLNDQDTARPFTETVSAGGAQTFLGKHGGWWRHTVTGDDGDEIMMAAEPMFEVDEGFALIFETRLQTSVSASSSIFVGMTDANTESNGILIEDEDGTMFTAPDDAFGFLLEGEQDETWTVVGVQNTADNNSGAPIAVTGSTDAANSVIQTLRMEASPNDSGTVEYFIDGALVSTRTSWFRSSILFGAAASSSDRNTAYLTDFDYFFVNAPRS